MRRGGCVSSCIQGDLPNFFVVVDFLKTFRNLIRISQCVIHRVDEVSFGEIEKDETGEREYENGGEGEREEVTGDFGTDFLKHY